MRSVTIPRVMHVEIESQAQFDRMTGAGATAMRGWRVQSVDLSGHTDVLLRLDPAGGIVYLPGAAGTVQEIFQAVTPNYYGDAATQIPMILVGADHWSQDVPVWDVLRALGHERHLAGSVHLVDSIEEATALVGAGLLASVT